MSKGKTQYGDHQQSSGVTHFEVTAAGISVWFGTKKYHYSHDSAGRDHVGAMKRLALGGAGLASYIRANRPDHEKEKA